MLHHASNAIRGVMGKWNSEPSVFYNQIEFVTITTLGNAIDFGDPTHSLSHAGCMHHQLVQWLLGEHHPSGRTNTIDYVQIMTTGNAVDFGDLTSTYDGGGWCIKWSWRFRIMSDFKINNITNRSGSSGINICWYIHSINICIYGDAKW